MIGERLMVIGATTPGGIGETIAKHATGMGFQVDTPTPYEMDVTIQIGIERYFVNNGTPSHLVYCAGIQKLGMLDRLDTFDVKDVFDVNVFGFISTLSTMVTLRHEGGRVCAISSSAGRIPMSGSIAYCSSKAALNHAVRCAARELKQKWQITAIVPGTVGDTPLTENVDQQVMRLRDWDYDELMAQERIRQPFGRRITKDEVAEVTMNTITGPMTLTGSIIDIAGGA